MRTLMHAQYSDEMKMLIDKRLSSPMYQTEEMGKRSKMNNWYVRERGSDQPRDQSWRAWWESVNLGKGHIKWRSTCVARHVPDPFKPPLKFEVDFLAPDEKLYLLEFTLEASGPNK